MFEEKAEKPENSKVEGKTVRVGMEGIMNDNKIDFGTFWAGDIHRNRCRKLMSCGVETTKSRTEFLHSMPAFGDLGEYADEWAHHKEASNKSRVAAVLNLVEKKRTKSQFEEMKKSAKVKETMSELKQNSKRKLKIDGPSQAEDNETES